jgi:hypothetical protein
MAKRKDDPCWEDYEQVGMKTKDGHEVPNCVPSSSDHSDHSELVVPDGWSVS